MATIWVGILTAAAALGQQAKEPVEIEFNDFKKYVNQEVKLQFQCKSVRQDNRCLVILDSEEDPASEDNLAVVILKADRKVFKDFEALDNFDELKELYLNKTVEAVGKIALKDGKYELTIKKEKHLEHGSSGKA